MSIHHKKPLLISWDEESGCYLVSDFGTAFKPIKTEESLGRFIKEYSEFADRVEWTNGRLVNKGATTRSHDLRLIDEWLEKNAVPKAEVKKKDFGSISLSDLLGD